MGGRRRQQRVVVAGEVLEQQRQILGDRLLVIGVLHQENPGDAGDLGGRVGDSLAVSGSHQQVDRPAERLRGGDRRQGRRRQLLLVVLRQNQCAHQITFASLRSFSTRVAMSGTFTPA